MRERKEGGAPQLHGTWALAVLPESSEPVFCLTQTNMQTKRLEILNSFTDHGHRLHGHANKDRHHFQSHLFLKSVHSGGGGL